MREKVLGFPVDVLSPDESYLLIKDWFKKGFFKPKIVVTAYSEFFVNGLKDKDFGNIIKSADLVTPDGNSVLAAVEYNRKTQELPDGIEDSRQSRDKNSRTQGVVLKILEGLKVGGKILNGKIGEPVTGVWLFEKITENAVKNNWKIFLLGGWNNLSGEVAEMLLKRFPGIRVGWDDGENAVGTDSVLDKQVVKKINNFKPDFLFVQYRPIVQEKWIASHLDTLKVGVAMGVGGTFDEYAGRLRLAPTWMQKSGLKWLWRLLIQPKRWRRMVDAVIVFPWLLFKESLKKG